MTPTPQLIGAAKDDVALQPAGVPRPARWRRDAVRRRLLAAADITAGLGCAFAIGLIPGSTIMLLFVPAVWIVLAKLHGLYDRDHRVLRPLTVDEFPRLVACVTMAAAVVGLMAELLEPDSVTPGLGLRLWLLALIATPLLRAGARQLWRQTTPPEATVIVGHGPIADATRRKVDLFHDIHSHVVGIVPESSLGALTSSSDQAWLREHTGDTRVDRILVASQIIDEALIAALVRFCRAEGIKLGVVPPARGMFGTAVQLDHVAELPIVQYNTWDIPRSTELLKRTMDIGVAGVALLLLSPLLAAIAVLVKLDSRGPAFFVQRRAGRDGTTFRMVKFRTMHRNAEAMLSELVRFDELAEPVFKLRSDPRITRAGRMLRRWSLDEVPQLFNVFLGHMSLVGPRPEQIELVEMYRPEHRFRLAVRPGLTGPMQVYGRGELTLEERLAVEREYVENLSLARDLRILLMTVSAVLTGRGAY